MVNQSSLTNMQSFVVVGKPHTLPEDAENLDMPMSKVSRAMPSMEAAARIHLFCREGGAVHLTDAGRDYLGASERALAGVWRGVKRTYRASGVSRRRLTCRGADSFCATCACAAFAELLGSLPRGAH